MKPITPFFAGLFLVLVPVLATAQTVTDQQFGFTFTVPPGFVASPDMKGSNANFIHAYHRESNVEDNPGIILIIERMRGLLGRASLKPDQLPAGFNGTISKIRWQDFEVELFEVPEQQGDLKLVTFNVQVPLAKEAIQIKVCGAVEARAEVRALLDQILSSLQGKSNWLASALGPSASSSSSYGIVLLVVLLLVVVGGVIVLWVLSKRAPKGTVLVISLVLWGAGALFAGSRTREVVGFLGAIQVVGFIGVILGIVDVVRKRRES